MEFAMSLDLTIWTPWETDVMSGMRWTRESGMQKGIIINRKSRLYPCRTFGRDYDHRHPDRVAVAGGASGTRGGQANAMQQQSQTTQLGLPDPRTIARILSLGRTGAREAGDPDLGFGKTQTGGWLFSVLPYIEQQSLHDLGAGQNFTAKKTAFAQREQTPLEMMSCPSRRPPAARPFDAANQPNNVDTLTVAAKGDYAANGGDDGGIYWCIGPGWPCTGICFYKSEIKAADVTDGLSCTFLLGEKYLNPDWYEARPPTMAQDGGDDNTMYFGDALDSIRLTNNPLNVPRQDQAGYPGDAVSFGSAHVGSQNMALCDGSVTAISYAIDMAIYANLGNRHDNIPIDGKAF